MTVLNELFMFQVIRYERGITTVEKFRFLWCSSMLDKQKNSF